MSPFDPVFAELERIAQDNPTLAQAFDFTDGDWVGWDLPPDAISMKKPVLRSSTPASTNSLENDEYTAVLTIWLAAVNDKPIDHITELAVALEEALNGSEMFHCQGWAVRQELNFIKAVYPLRFYL